MDSHLIFLLIYSISALANPCQHRHKSAFQHETDCEKYVYCKRGVPTVGVCPDGQVFDVHGSKCLPKEITSCSLSATRARRSRRSKSITALNPSDSWPPCGSYDDWSRPDPYDCTMYYLCYYGEMMHATCQIYYEFSPTQLECLPKELADCSISTTSNKVITTKDPWPKCGSYDDWSQPDPYDCTMYYLCYYGEMMHVTCQIDYEFSPTQLLCLPKNEAGCIISTTTSRTTTKTTPSATSTKATPSTTSTKTTPSTTSTKTTPSTTIPWPTCTNGIKWLLPDHSDSTCKHFILCVYGKISRERCPRGYLFHSTLLIHPKKS